MTENRIVSRQFGFFGGFALGESGLKFVFLQECCDELVPRSAVPELSNMQGFLRAASSAFTAVAKSSLSRLRTEVCRADVRPVHRRAGVGR